MDRFQKHYIFKRRAESSLMGTPLSRALSHMWALEEIIRPGTQFPIQSVRNVVIYLTESGHSTLKTKYEVVTHQPGTIVLIGSGTRIIESVSNDKPWHVRYLVLKGHWADQLNQTLWTLGKGIFVYRPAVLRWQRLFRECVTLALDQSPEWSWLFAGRLAELFGQVIRQPSPSNKSLGLVEQMQRLVDQAPDQPWKIDELAAALKISSSTLAHQFKNLTDQTPAHWVRERRIKIATRLLQQGLNVSQVAEQLAFADPFHFSRVFKEVTGFPPSHFILANKPSPLHHISK